MLFLKNLFLLIVLTFTMDLGVGWVMTNRGVLNTGDLAFFTVILRHDGRHNADDAGTGQHDKKLPD